MQTESHIHLVVNNLLLPQVLHDPLHRPLHIDLIRLDHQLRRVRSLVRRRDTRELLDLSRTGLLVETLGVSGLDDRERGVDEDFNERDGGGGGGVEGSGEESVGFV